jgi:hypothetical protein
MQLVNALGALYDGLLCASHNFSFVRNQLLFGLVVVFAPALVGKSNLGFWVWGLSSSSSLLSKVFQEGASLALNPKP